ncbi:hypothetical protein [Crossiella equi]|uniref:hypothetical protein n=1 Tax=Crossiella equi TaxID=130796 RepID=UPI000A38E5C7|nr:hypothetical protein [Crossiella equi]
MPSTCPALSGVAETWIFQPCAGRSTAGGTSMRQVPLAAAVKSWGTLVPQSSSVKPSGLSQKSGSTMQ